MADAPILYHHHHHHQVKWERTDLAVGKNRFSSEEKRITS
jgi:hypothetical protein